MCARRGSINEKLDKISVVPSVYALTTTTTSTNNDNDDDDDNEQKMRSIALKTVEYDQAALVRTYLMNPWPFHLRLHQIQQ